MDDLISRKAAIDAVEAIGHDTRYYWVIKDLPSAQPSLTQMDQKLKPTCEDCISRQAALHLITKYNGVMDKSVAKRLLMQLPSAQPMRKKGQWILDRSGAYCCSECMEPCASYVMMKPRDKFCKMCGSYNGGDKDD